MSLLTDVIQRPQRLGELSQKEWDQLLRFSRYAKVTATLHEHIEKLELRDQIPQSALNFLDAEQVRSSFMQLQAKRELHEIEQALAGTKFPIILLKGAAYIAGNLAPASGRRLSDIDLMVPQKHLEEIENKLLGSGWVTKDDLSDYDQNYYRDWSHEIPPLHHPLRCLEVDIHHNISPPTSAIKINADLLIEQATLIANSRFSILSPQDMFLHSATHLFMNDELRGGLRDLMDMHLLSTKDSNIFWPGLPERANQLGLNRPLYYAVTALQDILETPIPSEILEDVYQSAPNALSKQLMHKLVTRQLAPSNPEQLQAPFTQWLLFIRSHWVRMPPKMLLKHLSYKWWKKLTSSENMSK